MRFSYRDVLRLAWPNAIAMLSETTMGLVDTKLVGGLGGTALAGVGVGASFWYLIFVTVLGLTRGIKVCTAHAVGAGKSEVGVQYAILGSAMGAAVGCVAAFGLLHVHGLMLYLGIEPGVAAQASLFLSARCWGLPAACAVTALMEHRQGLGVVRRPALLMVLGNFVNAPLAYCLIYGHAGLPKLGVAGAGLGTSIAEWVLLTIATGWLLHTWYRQRRDHVVLQAWRTALFELTRLGVPTALHFGTECLGYVSFTAVLGSLQPWDVGSHQIAIAINRAAFLPGLAIGEAVCVLVGQSLGAGNLIGAEMAAAAGLRLAMAFMVPCGLVFVAFRHTLMSFFTNDMNIVHTGSTLLIMAAVFQLFDAVNLVMRSALRGAKDVKVPAFVGILILWTCVPTSAYVLGKLMHMGVVGGWFGFIAETICASAFFYWRWRRGAWRLPYIGKPSATAAQYEPTSVLA